MGKINDYQQAQLASSLVGTPGVDHSPLALANTLVGNQSSIASNLIGEQGQRMARSQSFANQQFSNAASDMDRARAYHNAATQKINEINYGAAAAKANGETDVAFYNQTEALKKQYKSTPDEAVKAIKDYSDTGLQDYFSEHPDVANNPIIAGKVAADWANKGAAAQVHIGKWKEEQNTSNGQADVLAAEGTFNELVAGLPPGDLAAFDAARDKYFQNTNTSYDMYYDPKEASKMKDAMGARASLTFLNSSARREPGSAIKAIRQGYFSSLLDEKQLESAIKLDTAYGKAAQAEATKEETQAATNTHFQLSGLLVQGLGNQKDPQAQANAAQAYDQVVAIHAAELAKAAPNKKIVDDAAEIATKLYGFATTNAATQQAAADRLTGVKAANISADEQQHGYQGTLTREAFDKVYTAGSAQRFELQTAMTKMDVALDAVKHKPGYPDFGVHEIAAAQDKAFQMYKDNQLTRSEFETKVNHLSAINAELAAKIKTPKGNNPAVQAILGAANIGKSSGDAFTPSGGNILDSFAKMNQGAPKSLLRALQISEGTPEHSALNTEVSNKMQFLLNNTPPKGRQSPQQIDTIHAIAVKRVYFDRFKAAHQFKDVVLPKVEAPTAPRKPVKSAVSAAAFIPGKHKDDFVPKAPPGALGLGILPGETAAPQGLPPPVPGAKHKGTFVIPPAPYELKNTPVVSVESAPEDTEE